MSQLTIFPDPGCPTGEWPEGIVFFENRMARVSPRTCKCGAVLSGAAFLKQGGDGFTVHYTHPAVVKDGELSHCAFAREVEGIEHISATPCE